MGEKSELQEQVEQYNEYISERRFLIVDCSFETKMHYHKRRCTENIKQYASICPTCFMFLNAPVQTCLARTAPPIKRRYFRRYKRFIKAFSADFQVVRSLLVEIEIPNVL